MASWRIDFAELNAAEIYPDRFTPFLTNRIVKMLPLGQGQEQIGKTRRVLPGLK
jgi:hypothetical protein